MFSVGVNLAAGTLSKLLGGQMLTDVQTFVAALDTMFGGFRERADLTYALLKEPATAFVVVAAPERDALREAAYFLDRLAQEGMPLAGLVVNRRPGGPRLDALRLTRGRRRRAAGGPRREWGGRPGRGGLRPSVALLRLHADLATTAARQRAHTQRFLAAHPSVEVVEVLAAATDIHDLAGLREVGAALGGR